MALPMARYELAALPELRHHPTDKRIRAFLDGEAVIDSTSAVIVWEPRRIVPSHAVPLDDLRAELVDSDAAPGEEREVRIGDGPPMLDPGTPFSVHTTGGRAVDLIVGGRTLVGAAFVPQDPDLAGHAIVDFDAFDEWREEDDVLVSHARDPFKTVDTRHSARRVVVEVDGTVLADSTRSVMLFETLLPTRYYLPRDDVRMDLLRPTPTTTACAYKGVASYWSVDIDGEVLDDVAWSYPDPHNYATAVEDMVAFLNERVDISVDGRRLERPRTPWS